MQMYGRVKKELLSDTDKKEEEKLLKQPSFQTGKQTGSYNIFI